MLDNSYENKLVEVSERIKELRDIYNLSDVEMADKTGVSIEEYLAYENGMDDFKRIDHVPVFAANLPVGHGGTYGQPLGGEYSIVATAWLSWQLKGDDEAGTMFTGTECGLSKREGWTVDKKNIP